MEKRARKEELAPFPPCLLELGHLSPSPPVPGTGTYHHWLPWVSSHLTQPRIPPASLYLQLTGCVLLLLFLWRTLPNTDLIRSVGSKVRLG